VKDQQGYAKICQHGALQEIRAFGFFFTIREFFWDQGKADGIMWSATRESALTVAGGGAYWDRIKPSDKTLKGLRRKAATKLYSCRS
jgi:hypothetical protein